MRNDLERLDLVERAGHYGLGDPLYCCLVLQEAQVVVKRQPIEQADGPMPGGR